MAVRVICLLGLFLWPAYYALGHADFLGSVPADGQRLQSSPPQLRLVFSEPLQSATVVLRGQDGRQLPLPAIKIAADAATLAVVPITQVLAAGDYAVEWKVLSVDGHTTSGSFRFSLDAQAPSTALAMTPVTPADTRVPDATRPIETLPEPSPPRDVHQHAAAGHAAPADSGMLEVLAKSVLYLAGLVLTGVNGIGLALGWGITLPATVWHSVRRATAFALVATGVAATSLLFTQLVLGAGLTSIDPDTPLVRAWVARVLICLVAGAVWRITVPSARWVAVAAGLLQQAVTALGSHAAALRGAGAALAFDWTHMAAGALWSGGVLWLWQASRHQVEATSMQQMLRRFGKLALAAVLAVSAAGIVLAAQQFSTASQLIGTEKGRLLLFKGLAVVVAMLYGGWHNRRAIQLLRVPGGARRLGRTLGFESAALCGVHLMAAVLSAMPPTANVLPQAGASATSGNLTVRNAFLTRNYGGGNSAGYMQIINAGDSGDQLIAVSAPLAGRVTMHDMHINAGVAIMVPSPAGFSVPAGAVTVLKPGAGHVMFEQLPRELRAGERLSITLQFASGTRLALEVPVLEADAARDQ